MIRKLLLMTSAAAIMMTAALMPQPAFAAELNPFDEVCKTNPNTAVCQDRRTNPNEGFYDFLQTIINTILVLLGSIAVIMLIIGGIRFILSGGDQAAITGARDTIIYALIGVIVAIMAYGIANFIIDALKGV